MTVCVPNQRDRDERIDDGNSFAVGFKSPGPVIRAEANLLRFPLFALHTKGIRALDGIRCSGRTNRNGETVQFSFTATRNTSTLYPGPLARSCHLAFLSLLTEAGRPVPHPLSWTWRDLCRRMNMTNGGTIVSKLKQAILSTAGLLIQSEAALYSKADSEPITTTHEALHLYERVLFAGTRLPDGTKVEENMLFLSDWYRENLNAYFTAPVDYPLWKWLDERSPIASRLYEFLLVNFYRPTPSLRFGYETLVQYLPVKAERYLSDAKRQLAGPFALLQSAGVLRSASWEPAKSGTALVVLEKGDLLKRASSAKPTLAEVPDDVPEAVKVEELKNLKPPEWFLVTDFYKVWTGAAVHQPTAKELSQAKGWITDQGVTRARSLVVAAIKHLRVKFPDAKAFGAVAMYYAEALADVDRAERAAENRKLDAARNEAERMEAAEKAARFASWKTRWEAASQEEIDAIRAAVTASQPRSIPEKHPDLFERFCVEEFGRRLE